MTIDELQKNPAIQAHFPEVARPIREFLVQHLVETCIGQTPTADTAQAQVGASKAIANLIKTFDSVAKPKAKAKPVTLKKLHRFSGEKPEGEEPSTPNS